ncbi:leaf rust 10 disease-resistance locus receptor-like protein kinase-like 1.2 [Quercus suber]|uniref:Leaf rust 10 disease-resistance locus receptor-like protein kinase-like 1.2 n=1 Tax=Quercus suber TaxID=58331 RepID=A0AAW0KYN5_QUESU
MFFSINISLLFLCFPLLLTSTQIDLQNLSMSPKPSLICILFIIFTSLLNYILSLDPKFQACVPCTCGDGPNISYPFWVLHEQEPLCGNPNFQSSAKTKTQFLQLPMMIISLRISFTHTMYEDTCPAPLHNVSLDQTPFNFSLHPIDLSIFYNCTSMPNYCVYKVDCASNSTYHSFAVFHKEALELYNYSSEWCQSIVDVPVNVHNGFNFTSLLLMNYTEVLKMGFSLNWSDDCSSCERSSGRCGFVNDEFVCFCHDQPHLKTCDDGAGSCLILVLLIPGVVFFIHRRRMKKKYDPSILLSRSVSYDPSGTTDQERGSSYFGIHLFTYNELEQATNNFDSAKELGDGGFGTVAVKRLYEHNCKRVEQFMNEVEILTRLRHPNLVSLYGCTSRTSRELLLVYEYIPNGTVADHLHGDLAKPGALPFPTRMKIAIQNHTLHELVDPSLGFESDCTVKNMITDVAELAFQCLQYVKEMRPSMVQVLEALKDIQHRDYVKDKGEINISADDVVLLKNDSVPLSPDSALNWNISTSTTSNGSR